MKVDLFSVDTKKASEALKDDGIVSSQAPCKQEDVDLMNKLLKGDPQEKQFMDWLSSIETTINEENIQAMAEDEQLSEIVSDFVSELKAKNPSGKVIPSGVAVSPQKQIAKNTEQVAKAGEQIVKNSETSAHESKTVKHPLHQHTEGEKPLYRSTEEENLLAGGGLREKKNKDIAEVGTQKESLTQEDPLAQPLISVPPSPVEENVNQVERTTVVAPHAIELAQQIKDQMVDRILVSSSDLNENREIILKLNPNLLAETQVSFQKVGQALQVQFMSQNADSLKFLSVFQLDLQGYLQDELKNFRSVSVRIQQGSTDMGQPQDGRSRNPYEYQNLDDDNDPTFIA